ncbi:helix-hairpin-helix domain-containing protein [Butyrivibrio sp. MC2013]|uniref:helix-hairpin-helix domain-containing protein n=1 Tax=Butyrivibrio sp. MC2013 TaxID=1280686 RepID=UPI000426F17C|nr:helix-hairpin-helix domain-containing protein [Butyrivibrio sp. MC2013]
MQNIKRSFKLIHRRKIIIASLFIILTITATACRLKDEGLQIEETSEAFSGTDNRCDPDESSASMQVSETDSAAGDPDKVGEADNPVVQEGMAEADIAVFICGEVVDAGVYTLPGDSRVADAIETAGGFTETADREYLNLALPLTDGMKIDVPSLEETSGSASGANTAVGGREQSSSEAAYGISTAGDVQSESDSSLAGTVNINTASEAELMTLPGIGQAKAATIIAFRQEHGSFDKIDDIMKVSGIGEKMFDKIRNRIVV